MRLTASVLLALTILSLPDTISAAPARCVTQTATSSYTCPMHPDVTAESPGRCPKCGMTLTASEPVKESSSAPVGADDTTQISSKRRSIPDIAVLDQDGHRRLFYSDLVKGKTVAINFIFTTCTTICPPLTATFQRVQQELAEPLRSRVTLISISVDPNTDTPERLREFASKFGARPGWTFVTGRKTEIDEILRGLGGYAPDKIDHTPMVLIINDSTGFWTRSYGLGSPGTLVKAITAAATGKSD